MNANQLYQNSKELMDSILEEEERLYTTVSKWKRQSNGVLLKWQIDTCNRFLKKKAMVQTIVESYQELLVGMDLEKHAVKLDTINSKASVMVYNSLIKLHYDSITDFFIKVENGEKIPFGTKQGIYNLLGGFLDRQATFKEILELEKEINNA